MFKAVVAILILACTISRSAVAGAFEDGSNAWDRGDYVSAMRLLRPLADRGHPKAPGTWRELSALPRSSTAT
jgi:hypothetical protein